MPPITSSAQGLLSDPARLPWAAGLLIVVAVLLAYANALRAPFVFDDVPAILENPAISHRSGFEEAHAPAHQARLTVGGRPVAALTLKLNWALSGDQPWSYHLANVLIHAAAALALFGVVRRTLLQPALGPRFGAAALPLALLIALLWALHPLQTESVTYIVQRVESLMGFFYLFALYAFIRSTGPGRPALGWAIASVTAVALGMGTKEVMVSAPLMVLCYDRAFVAGSFRAAWAQRRGYYLALGATWLVLLGLVLGAGGRGGTAGFSEKLPVLTYFLTQCHAVPHYLRLALWPSPLVLDYGTWTVRGFASVAGPALLLAALAGASLVGFVRNRPAGFLGAWFFALLAPSSSVVPVITQTMAEHRIYLALAAVVAAPVAWAYARFGRRVLWAGAVWAVVLGGLTVRRNLDYRSELAIWSDTVAKRPENARARHSLGLLLVRAGRLAEAIAEFEAALQLAPAAAAVHNDFGLALRDDRRAAEAGDHFATALRLQPDFPQAHNNLGLLLLDQGRVAEAAAHFTAALQLKPDFAQPHNNLGNVHLREGRMAEALASYEAALRLKPDYAPAQFNAGNVLLDLGRKAEAARQFEAALQAQPDYAEAANNLGGLLVEFRDFPAAAARYEQALRAKPDLAEARHNLVLVLEHLGRHAEAEAHGRIYLETHPADPAMRATLERLRAGSRGQ